MNTVDLENRILGSSAAARARRAGPRAAAPAGRASARSCRTSCAARAGVKFSGHAQARLASRKITLSGEDIAKSASAMTRAAAKGAR